MPESIPPANARTVKRLARRIDVVAPRMVSPGSHRAQLHVALHVGHGGLEQRRPGSPRRGIAGWRGSTAPARRRRPCTRGRRTAACVSRSLTVSVPYRCDRRHGGNLLVQGWPRVLDARNRAMSDSTSATASSTAAATGALSPMSPSSGPSVAGSHPTTTTGLSSPPSDAGQAEHAHRGSWRARRGTRGRRPARDPPASGSITNSVPGASPRGQASIRIA